MIAEKESVETGITLSAHVESVILRRVNADVNVNDLKKRVFLLEAETSNASASGEGNPSSPEIEKLKTGIRALKRQKFELLESLKTVIAQRDALAKSHGDMMPHWLSREGRQKAVEHLSKLNKRFPKHDFERLLVASLAVALKNTNSF